MSPNPSGGDIITLKFKQKRSLHTEICPKGADGMANSADPDQTPIGAVLSGCALFAKD